MEEPKHLIDRAISTDDEGMQELRDRMARAPTAVSDSTMDTLREREEAKADHEERMHWRWLGKAMKNLMVWVAAVGAFLLVLVDMVVRMIGDKR